MSNNRTSNRCLSKRRSTGVWQDGRPTPTEWQSKGTPTVWISSLQSSAGAWGRPISSLSSRTTKGVKENALSKSMQTELSGYGRPGTLPVNSTSPRSRDLQGRSKQARRTRRSGATEVSKPSSDANAPSGAIRSSEMGWRKTPQPNKQTNKPNRVMEKTPIKIHAVCWTPSPSHVGSEEVHTRPL